jgi:hypothetical protein
MKVWGDKEYEEAMESKTNHPIGHGISHLHLGNGIIAILKEYFGAGLPKVSGFEIGSGSGRVAMHIANSIRMDTCEPCEYLAKSGLGSNFYCFIKDFFEIDPLKFQREYKFLLIDGHNFNKKEVEKMEEHFLKFADKQCLIFFTGNTQSKKMLEENLKEFKLNLDIFETIIEPDLKHSKFDFEKSNFSIFERGRKNFEIDENSETSPENNLKNGRSVSIDRQSIEQVQTKALMVEMIESLGYGHIIKPGLQLKGLKHSLLKELGL